MRDRRYRHDETGRTEARRSRWLNAVLALAILSVGLAACHGCHATGPATSASAANADVTPTLRLYFLSDVAGAIEPCGCVKDQLGGLSHAAAWLDEQRARIPSSLLVTAGPTFFMDPVLEPDHRAQDLAKADALARSLRHLGFAGWAPGANDWAGGSVELGKLALVSAAPPLLSNAVADAGTPLLPTRLIDLGNVRVALIGVGALDAAAPGKDAGVAVREASQAARGAGANLVVVLASVGRGEAKRIADAVPDLTAIVVGNAKERGEANVPSPPGERVGNVIIAETANHLQAIGALDFFVRDGSYAFADATGLGEAAKRTELTRRIDELHSRIAAWERDKSIAAKDLEARKDDLAKLEAERANLDVKPAPASGSYFRYAIQEVRPSLGEDPSVKESLAAYYTSVNDANRVAFEGKLPPPAEPGQPAYAGIAVCGACHVPAKTFWNKTAHAHAYVTLSSEHKEFNLDCVGCHVTGYEKPGGSSVTHVDQLKDVQCEVCHGPGSLHAKAPTSAPIPVARPQPSMCLDCHRPPHVERFDAVAKVNEILGPGHGR